MYIFTFPQKSVKDMSEIELSKTINYLKIKWPDLSFWFDKKDDQYIEFYTNRIHLGNNYYIDNDYTNYHSFKKISDKTYLLCGTYNYTVTYDVLNNKWLTKDINNYKCVLSIEPNYGKFRNALRYLE